MSAELILWMPDNLRAPWIWWQSETESGEVKTDSEKASLKALDFKTLTVIVSGQSIRTYPHDLPDMRITERRKAATIFVEDLLAGSSRDHHVALSATGREGATPRLAVISSDRMNRLIQSLSEMGLKAHTIIADYDAVPLHVGPILLEDRFLNPGPQGYTIDKEWGETDADVKAVMQAALPRDIYAILPELETESAINLAQGPYVPKQAFLPEFELFKRAAALLGVFGLTWLVWQGAQWRSMTMQTKTLKTEASDLYFSVTGKRVANPALEVTRAVKSGPKSEGNFLKLSSVLFESISGVDGVEIDRLQYDSMSNALSLRLFYPGFETVARLEKDIAARGAIFESGGVREQSGRMIGEATVILSEGGPS